jgi:glycine C-acetyltransferase
MVGQVDIITSTLGKALGGAAGGFIASTGAVCDYLTQRARPQLFSNACRQWREARCQRQFPSGTGA